LASLGEVVRNDFPILKQMVHEDKPLLYLDSAATSQKPLAVTKVLREAAINATSSLDEGQIAERLEEAREKVASLVNSPSSSQIIFTRGATESLNLVARGWGEKNIDEGDEIILSVMEHHSNMVPWQALAERKGAKLKFVPLTKDQSFDLEAYKTLLVPGKTKIVAINHVSNVLGCVNPVEDIVRLAHEAGAVVSVDACQSVPHMPVDVQRLDVDFLAASGHKMLGPTGIGFLWGREKLLEEMEPLHIGSGSMTNVVIDGSQQTNPRDMRPIPWRFEAGQPPLAEAIALGEACKYLEDLGMRRVHEYEVELGTYLWNSLAAIDGVVMYGPPPDTQAGQDRGALVAFNCPGVHANDLAFFLDQEGVAIRSGHHCTQPLHRSLGVAGSARASLYVYNTLQEVDRFCSVLKRTLKMFSDMGFGVEDSSPCPLVSTSDPNLRDPGIGRPCTDLWPRLSDSEEYDSEEDDGGWT